MESIDQLKQQITTLTEDKQQLIIACEQALSALNIAAGKYNRLYTGERVLLKTLLDKFNKGNTK